VKPGTENTRGLRLEVVKFKTVQMSRLPLYHRTSKIGIICSAEPDMTEDLC
jgi:hypothetical protein